MGADAKADASAQAQQVPASSAWRKVSKVLKVVQASQGFNTLRDMISEEAAIDSSRLQIHSSLGEGAFAEVFLATLDTSRAVAVKSLKPTLLQEPEEVRLFLSENEVLRKLRHANIVELIGIGGVKHSDGRFAELYIVQELCPGGSLRDLVFQQMIHPHSRKYTKQQALKWCLELAKALAYLHGANPKVIHRDLKLDNVLLTARNPKEASAKLADFGLARLVKSKMRPEAQSQLQSQLSRQMSKPPTQWSSDMRQRSSRVMTVLDRVMSGDQPTLERTATMGSEQMFTQEAGSYGYMAPEVLRGDSYNEKADIFSFAMVMYNLFYSVIPSVLILQNGEQEDMMVYAWEVASGYRPKLNPERVPEEINELINACWNGIPELRPSAADVVTALKDALQKGVCNPPPKSEGGCCTVM